MDIDEGIKVRRGVVEIDCLAMGIGSLLRPYLGKQGDVTTHG